MSGSGSAHRPVAAARVGPLARSADLDGCRALHPRLAGRDRARRRGRPRRPRGGADDARRAAPRRGQDHRPARGAAQARPARRGRVRHRQAPSERERAARRARRPHEHRHAPAPPPRALGRHGLPARPRGRAHPARLARARDRRRLRRDARRPPLPQRDDRARGEQGARAGAGTQFDPVLVEAFLRRGIGHSAQLRPQRVGAPCASPPDAAERRRATGCREIQPPEWLGARVRACACWLSSRLARRSPSSRWG